MSTHYVALLGQTTDYPIRATNKEPEWSSICNDVFDQYLDSGALFGLGEADYERSSSNVSANLFDFSERSEPSHRTDATSPLAPFWDTTLFAPDIEARQPKAIESSDFWQKTLKALERNAAECEVRQQNLRSSKSHPDFLSLGGNPSPPAVPSSPVDRIDQAFTVQQERLPRPVLRGKRRNYTSRSLSRGGPSAATKAGGLNWVNTQPRTCTQRASPPKMPDPNRYRPGFRDLWAAKIQKSPGKYALRVPLADFPASPPRTALRAPHLDEFDALQSTFVPAPAFNYDEHISPLINTFQQTHLHTPMPSPMINHAAHSHNASLEPLGPLPPSTMSLTTVPLNDTAPLYPERATALAPDHMAAFDFGFSPPPRDEATWSSAARYMSLIDPLDAFHGGILPSIEPSELPNDGSRTVCDPPLVSNYNLPLDSINLPALTYAPTKSEPATTYHPLQLGGLPTTPTRHARGRRRTPSASPPATESRLPARKRSSSRRAASRHHRRTKSTGATSTPRHQGAADKVGDFVNFTPDDSCKILSGVAPSGSSKTKARREKEAADRRRRLSQAAIRAVVAAGGDVDALSEAGLLI